MLIVGVVGGVASGKSLVARQLQQHGAGILDGDRTGHKVLEDIEVREKILSRWGARVLTDDGCLSRSAIAQIVFEPSPQSKHERRFLEQLTHPKIRELLEQEVQSYAAAGKAVVVLDAALLIEAGWKSLCDKIIYVEVPREVRLERARQRGWSEEEFIRREQAQLPLDEKRKKSDFVIVNSGTGEQLSQAVDVLWEELLEENERKSNQQKR